MSPARRPVSIAGSDLARRRARQREALLADGANRGELRAIVSPYRVCPLGAHSDHQHAPVLATAIDAHTLLSFAPASGAEVELRSENFPGTVRFDLRALDAQGGAEWGRYARAAAWALRERLPDPPRGLRGVVGGPLPGGGLSSSASVLLAYLAALAHVNEIAPAPRDLVLLSRRAENEFVGLASGVLDPAAIVGSRRGQLLAIDTREVRWEPVPSAPGAPAVLFLVIFTGTPRSLTGTGFNQRVEECRRAAHALAQLAGLPATGFLGELPDAVFEAHLPRLEPALQRRARHVFSERARVLRGIQRWGRGELAEFGALMNESCASSLESYQTGSPELACLQQVFEATPGVLGARFSGAGYGGCGVALVLAEAAQEARDRALAAFTQRLPALAGRATALLVQGEDGLRLEGGVRPGA
jgi:galactokinase/galacturonokinase